MHKTRFETEVTAARKWLIDLKHELRKILKSFPVCLFLIMESMHRLVNGRPDLMTSLTVRPSNLHVKTNSQD